MIFPNVAFIIYFQYKPYKGFSGSVGFWRDYIFIRCLMEEIVDSRAKRNGKERETITLL